MVDYTRGRCCLSLKNFFGARQKADGWFRQLERLVRTHAVQFLIIEYDGGV
jgi:hypothetical protein